MKLESKADLQGLINTLIPESLVLDYKQSDALANTDGKKRELCKDVSSFANSAGGHIIYGIPEVSQVPQPLDGGLDKNVITPEWIEQVINSNIQPKIDGLKINQIDAELGNNQVYYVIEIPQATSRAPHQAPDNKYYKRYNFQSVAMQDYEIRDILKRSTTPSLDLKFLFSNGNLAHSITIPQHPGGGALADQTQSDPITINVSVHNSSLQPAEYTIIDVYVHPRLLLQSHPNYTHSVQTISSPVTRLMNVLSRQLSIPNDMPIFKEAPRHLPGSITFKIQATDDVNIGSIPFPFGYRLRCPGMDTVRWGTLHVINHEVHIEMN